MFRKQNQQEPKIPGRVAASKRLAEHNRKVREEQKKQIEAQKPTTDTNQEANQNTTEQSSNNTNTGYFILGIGGLIVCGLGVYYQRAAITRTLGRSQKTVESNTVVEDNPPPPEPKPKVKCGIIKMK